MIYLKTQARFEQIEAVYQSAYSAGTTPFVRLRPNALPQLRDVVETNYCDIGFLHDAADGQLVIGSAIDNLLKGAAGQAVQNLNVMHGWPETTGLL
jgi:N-acetyl-gamma-glutamyl-phosphate reductase